MYGLPDFNLEFYLWHGKLLNEIPTGAPDVIGDAALVCWKLQGYANNVHLADIGYFDAMYYFPELLTPALTDIRDVFQGTGYDIVEVPSGSGRFYSVLAVEDVAKGHPNEFRKAAMRKIIWPTPAP